MAIRDPRRFAAMHGVFCAVFGLVSSLGIDLWSGRASRIGAEHTLAFACWMGSLWSGVAYVGAWYRAIKWREEA